MSGQPACLGSECLILGRYCRAAKSNGMERHSEPSPKRALCLSRVCRWQSIRVVVYGCGQCGGSVKPVDRRSLERTSFTEAHSVLQETLGLRCRVESWFREFPLELSKLPEDEVGRRSARNVLRTSNLLRSEIAEAPRFVNESQQTILWITVLCARQITFHNDKPGLMLNQHFHKII